MARGSRGDAEGGCPRSSAASQWRLHLAARHFPSAAARLRAPSPPVNASSSLASPAADAATLLPPPPGSAPGPPAGCVPRLRPPPAPDASPASLDHPAGLGRRTTCRAGAAQAASTHQGLVSKGGRARSRPGETSCSCTAVAACAVHATVHTRRKTYGPTAFGVVSSYRLSHRMLGHPHPPIPAPHTWRRLGGSCDITSFFSRRIMSSRTSRPCSSYRRLPPLLS